MAGIDGCHDDCVEAVAGSACLDAVGAVNARPNLVIAARDHDQL